jgi:oligopeptide transport system substrate-binding protein
MRRVLAVLVILIAGLAGLVASERPLPRADFTFINRGDLTTLDLSRMSWSQDLRVAAMLFETLVRNDLFSPDYAKVPAAAERWTLSDDRKTWTFHLRKNARWSNGDPVKAGDFVYAWRRAMLPDTAGDYVKLFHLIEGGKEFTAWRQQALEDFAKAHAFAPSEQAARDLWVQTKAHFDKTVALRAIDDWTLEVRTKRVIPYFLDVMAFEVTAPLHPDLIEAHQSFDPSSGRISTRYDWTRPDRFIGNGPMKLAVWRFKRDVRLEKNPMHWNVANMAIDSIAMPSVEDRNAAVLAFQSGAVDAISDTTADYRGDMLLAKWQFYKENQAEVDRLRALGLDQFAVDRALPKDPRKHIHAVPAFGTYFYNFNCRPKLPDGRDNPFADARVRRAFAMAVDRQNVADNIRRQGERVASTLVPPGGLPGYQSPKGLAFDPAAARELLAEAGYPGGRGLPTIEILFNRDAGHDLIAQAVKSDWERHLGVRVALQQREIKVFRNDLKTKNFMVSRAAWFGDYGDPLTFLDLNRTGDGNNDRDFSYEPYDSLLAAADAEPDPAKRYQLLTRAETMLAEEQLPLIPFFHYNQVYSFNVDKVLNISPHPRQKQYLHMVDIVGDGKGTDVPKQMPKSGAR